MTETSPIDIQTIETLKTLMKDKFNFLIETFFTNTTKNIAELQAALDENNTDEIIALSHAIKGSSGSVGASIIHEHCRVYEEKSRAGELDNCEDWARTLTTEFNRYKEGIQKYL